MEHQATAPALPLSPHDLQQQHPLASPPYPQPGPQPVPYGAPQPAPYGAPQPGPYGPPQPAPYGAPQPAPYSAPQPAPYGPPQPAPYGAPPTGVVTGQPKPGEWMPPPQYNASCPPGLEYLSQIDQLLVKQKVELLEAFTGFETKNKYEVKNSMGQTVYSAKEISDCCTRQCCGPARPFEMKIVDNMDHEVIHLNRPLACSSCCFPCCLQSLEVTSPPGTVIGSIEQEWSIFKPKFGIKNEAGERVLSIEGPFCTFSCGSDVEFHVYSADGATKVGKVSKQWTGFVREAFTDADNFGINFPIDLDVKMKAVLLGACFLIDFMFFEKANNKEHDSPGMF